MSTLKGHRFCSNINEPLHLIQERTETYCPPLFLSRPLLLPRSGSAQSEYTIGSFSLHWKCESSIDNSLDAVSS